jgi:TetR/AcrR family transcriptional regulator, transcriptional repressor for nem operon
MAEYERAGMEHARVEDIVASAGVSWGTFFHYFPTKEDVLLHASATVCQAYAGAAAAGLGAGRGTQDVLWDAFTAMFGAAVAASGSHALRGAMMRQVLSHPGLLTAYLGEDVPPPVRVTAEVIAAGQRRGEVRADEPAEALGVIVLYAVLFAAQRGVTIGHPEGSSPLGRLALEITLRGMRPEDGRAEQVSSLAGAHLGTQS